MSLVQPTPPPFDPLAWRERPLSEQGRMVCESWAMQGYGTPLAIFGLYAVKVGLYVAGWVFFCSFSRSLGGPSTLASWWLRPEAFQKAIVWSLLFEILGLGCGSGPLTGRYFPPVGGALYFLRMGTTKLPLFPRLPLFGGTTRGPLDIALYLAVLLMALRALVAHRDYPRDLRPSRLASIVAHGGALLEFGVPLAFVLTPTGTPPVVAIILMIGLHAFITSNVPMGVPIEWNVMVVYGGFALFWAHPDVPITAVGGAGVAAFLLVMLVALPLFGNLFPARLSFLMSMRYYAGNWAYSVWLFRGQAYKKLERLTGSTRWVHDQLARFYDRSTVVGLVSAVMGFRLMHLHGRALPVLVPKAVDRFEEYEWMDGELVAGLALGWNFGEGHLHQEQLLASIQAQCGFEDGELRCVFVESQPLGRSTLAYRIADAKTGTIERGDLAVSELRSRQPWSAAS